MKKTQRENVCNLTCPPYHLSSFYQTICGGNKAAAKLSEANRREEIARRIPNIEVCEASKTMSGEERISNEESIEEQGACDRFVFQKRYRSKRHGLQKIKKLINNFLSLMWKLLINRNICLIYCRFSNTCCQITLGCFICVPY